MRRRIIERYKRRESSAEEALVEMYSAGVSVRRVEDITEALRGTRVSSSTVSEMNKRIYERIESWRTRPLDGEHPYLMLDGIWLKRSWGGEVKNIAVLVTVGVRADGHREILGVAEGAKEDSESWRAFLRYLKERGLCSVRMITSDKCIGLVEALGEFFPEAAWQRCEMGAAHLARFSYIDRTSLLRTPHRRNIAWWMRPSRNLKHVQQYSEFAQKKGRPG